MDYKVVIPSAGIGSRVGPYTKFMNKALITLGDKPVISHIIDCFPRNISIVVLLGYKGDLVRQSVEALYPDRKIEFVNVDKYDGPGSGLGYSLLQAKENLCCPFVFVSNDTLADFSNKSINPALVGNWLGYYKKTTGDNVPSEQYRGVSVVDGRAISVMPKGLNLDNAYIGACGILDFELFWEAMENSDALDIGESYGLNKLKNISAIRFESWSDAGNLISLKKAKNRYKLNDVNILEKEDEAIWFNGNFVTKFHVDTKFISDRVDRFNEIDEALLPTLVRSSQNTYTYEHVNGIVLSSVLNQDKTKRLLSLMQSKLWRYRDISIKKEDFVPHLDEFYRQKTIARVEHYFNRFEMSDKDLIINGVECPMVRRQIEMVNWDFVFSNAVIARFHGDFHSENILETQDGFKLLDWRQNFGSLGKSFGDVNYDLAKFLHGLIVSHDAVDKERFQIEHTQNGQVRINIAQPFVNVEAISVLEDFCLSNGYNFDCIKLLTAIVFLNICSLHEYPYSEFLYYLGRYLLAQHQVKNRM